jgi:hypothetical protein
MNEKLRNVVSKKVAPAGNILKNVLNASDARIGGRCYNER